MNKIGVCNVFDIRVQGFSDNSHLVPSLSMFWLCAVVQQAKLMKQKAGIEDEEDEEAEEQERAVWGRGKKTYYNADNVDFEVSIIVILVAKFQFLVAYRGGRYMQEKSVGDQYP
jgi:hypothetical protein